jgi:hypothetical protein
MLWLGVFTLPDGGRVESCLLGIQTSDTGRADRLYRLRLTDGSVTEFSTLTSTLQHLLDHYDHETLILAANNHEALTADLAAASPGVAHPPLAERPNTR